MKTKRFLAGFAAAVLCSCVSYAADKDIITQSFDVKPGGHLSMKVDRGTIHVTTSNSDKVDVKVVREARKASESKAKEIYQMHKVDITQAGDTVRIEAKNEGNFWNKSPFNNLQVEYTVSIPKKFDLDLHTAGGNIEISDVEGEVIAQTSGGNISLDSAKGNANLRTSGGNLHVGDVEGDVDAGTSGGSIDVERVKGTANVHTSGGDIRVREAHGTVSAHTSGGNVSAQLSDQPNSKCALRTSGGNVSVTLADKVAVDVNAHTSGGRIKSDFPGDFNKQKTKLVAQVNGGGPGLILETSGGNVDIRKQ